MVIQCAAASHPGRLREDNQDAWAIQGVVGRSGFAEAAVNTESELFRRHGLLVAVADGMGGPAGGAEASRIVLSKLSELYYSRPLGQCTRDELVAEIRDCVEGAGSALRDAAAHDPGLSEAGTTLCALVAQADGGMAIFWAGDSRAVWITPTGGRQLTVDHTARSADDGMTDGSSHAAAGSPPLIKSIDALGSRTVDFTPEGTWVSGERYVLGTDGWHGAGRGLSWDDVARTVSRSDSPASACRDMVSAAVAQDGSDNATALAIWFEG